MKKINFNIELPKEDVFNGALFKKENPELYEKYIIPASRESSMEQIQNTIENMLMRSLNGYVFDEKTKTEKPTKSSDMKTICNFSRVSSALKNQKDGWVKIEDADFLFLKENWEKAKMPVYTNTANNLAAINEAIEIAASKRGNPDDKEKEMIE